MAKPRKNSSLSPPSKALTLFPAPDEQPVSDARNSFLKPHIALQLAYRFMPTSSSVRKVSLTKSVVGTTIDANDCPIDGVKEGT